MALCSFSFQQVKSQDSLSIQKFTPDSQEYKERYTKLKEYYIKMLDSKASVNYNILKSELFKKVHYDGTSTDDFGNGIQTESIKAWVAENLHKTDFETYEDAKAEFKKVKDAYSVMFYENIDLYKYLQECYKICSQKLVADVYTAVMEIYGDNFHL